MTELDYHDWCVALKNIAILHGFRDELAADYVKSNWKDFYNAGFSPDEAFQEDMSRGP